MRFISCAVIILILFLNLGAQTQESLNYSDKGGGFGGPVFKLTTIYNSPAVVLGGRGGWSIDRTLYIGGGIYGLFNKIDSPAGILPLEGPLDIDFIYFGFEAEYIVQYQSFGHLSVYAITGTGVARYVKDTGSAMKSSEQSGEGDLAFVFEPALTAEFYLNDWLRLNAGISYRLVTGISLTGLKSNDFSGMAATLTFKFGRF